MFNTPLAYDRTNIPEEFEITTDRSLMREAAAVVFHIPSLPQSVFDKFPNFIHSVYSVPFSLKRLRKKKGQIWVAWFMECEVNIPHFNNPSFLNNFDWTMSYHLDADIVTPYYYGALNHLLKGPVREKSAEKKVCAFISSSFHASGRLTYLKALMNYLEIHSYGKVLRNKTLETDTGHPSKMETMAGYKFTIAFENAIMKDYVTEKFFDPLIAGSVPIYLGAPNIGDFTPGDKCFINASDWDSPEALARYILTVSNDQGLYQSYFDWKSKPFRPDFIKLLEEQKEHSFVRLCRKIQEIK
jgi:hypothetical protein